MGREEGGGFRMGTHVCLWWIHFDIWQNQYDIVKFKNKINKKKSRIAIIISDKTDFRIKLLPRIIHKHIKKIKKLKTSFKNPFQILMAVSC